MIDDLTRLGLGEAAAGIRDGHFTSEMLTRQYLQQIRSFDSRIHAWAWLDEDRTVEDARAADSDLRKGRLRGPLHGIPVGIKDIFYTRGIPTQMGSPIFRDFVPTESAGCVSRLELAGAIVLGKTATTEFANQHPALTTNPWNQRYSPGGSSSGSAAAVAARMAPAALGSQTRGSTIRPAAYCGIVGYKPSFGLVSRFGMHQLSWTLDHVGVLARSIQDAGLLTAALIGHDARDAASLSDQLMPVALDAVQPLLRAPRLAAIQSPAWKDADSAQKLLFEANCQALREAGADVSQVELAEIFSEAAQVARVIQLVEIARNFAGLYRNHGSQMSDTFLALVEQGMKISCADYWLALETREFLRRSLAEIFTSFDAILTPPATGEAPATLSATGNPAFCTLWTLCGLPALVFPTGLGAHGLPMGLQIVGGERADRRTLDVAKWCQIRLPSPCEWDGALENLELGSAEC